MDPPGPQQPRCDILSWLKTTWTPRVYGGHFAFFVPNPYNMSVYGLPWTPTVKLWHLDRADSVPPGHWWRWGHFFATNPYNMGVYRPKGMQRSLCLFCLQPQQYGCQQTPLDTNSQDLPFWADSGPPGHWLHQGHFFVPNSYNMGVYGLPWTQAIKIWHFELTQDNLDIGDSEG